jgi:hypothetical protein
MDPGAAPPSLPALSQVEEMVIARAHVQMVIKRVRGHQYHYPGHCISFMPDNIKLFDALPLMPEELDVVLLRPNNANKDDPRYHRQFQRDFRMLSFLKANHPDYKHIALRLDRYDNLPEDGDVSDYVPFVLGDEDEILEREANEEVIPDNPDTLDDDLLQCPVTESMIPNLNVHASELDLIRRAFELGPGPTPDRSATVQQAPFLSTAPALSFWSTPSRRGCQRTSVCHCLPHVVPLRDGRLLGLSTSKCEPSGMGGSSPSIPRRSVWSPPAFSVLSVQYHDESTG